MLQRPFFVNALLALSFLVSSAGYATDRALVLTGNDFGLYSVDLAGGPVQSENTYGGYPGTGYHNDSYYIAVISGEDQAYVYSLLSLTPVSTLSTGAGSNPYAATMDDAGRVFVTCLNSNQVARFDLAGNETGRVSVGRSPQGIIFHQGLIYVANTGFRFSDYGYDPGTVMVLDPASMTVVDTIAVGLNPQALVSDGTDIHTLCTGDYFSVFGQVHIMETAEHTVTDTVTLGGSPGAVAIEGTAAFVTDYFGGIFSYDISSRTVLHDSSSPISVGGSGYTSCAGDGMGNLYVTLYDNDVIAKVSLATELVTATFAAGDGPQHVVITSEVPTPVYLFSFLSERTSAGVVLTWSVSPDMELAALILERATAGGWQSLSEVPLRGRFVDTGTHNSTEYRLRAVQRDGSYEVLGRTHVSAGLPLSVRALRNPTRNTLTFRTAGITGEGRLNIYDAAGRLVHSQSVEADGVYRVIAPVPGHYFVRLIQGHEGATTRVVVLP